MTYHGQMLRREIDHNEVGWCHQCGTLQLFIEAPWLPIPYWGNAVHPCCSRCRESEPWEMGIWDVTGRGLEECARLCHETSDPSQCEECVEDSRRTGPPSHGTT